MHKKEKVRSHNRIIISKLFLLEGKKDGKE
jgi:hypothetical protein